MSKYSLLNLKFDYEYWMQYALQLAQCAEDQGEVPVGAVLLQNNQVVSVGWNQMISRHDPTAHAEIVALQQGGFTLRNYRLSECILFVTLEPCIMCAGAILNGRIDVLVYGAYGRKTGAAGSIMNIFNNQGINHRTRIISGVLEKSCSRMLSDFFDARRLQKKLIKIRKFNV